MNHAYTSNYRFNVPGRAGDTESTVRRASGEPVDDVRLNYRVMPLLLAVIRQLQIEFPKQQEWLYFLLTYCYEWFHLLYSQTYFLTPTL